MSSADLIVLHDRCVTGLLSCAENISEHLDDKNKRDQIEKLQKIVENYCEYEYRNKVFDITKDHMKSNMTPEIRKSNDNGLSEFKKTLDGKVKSLKKPEIHPLMETFKSKISLNGTIDFNDSDLITTECTEQYIDPFTKRQIQRPVKNKICSHIYEESSIKELLKINKRLRCPVIGCGNREIIKPNDCIFDEMVMARMAVLENLQ